MQILLVEDDFSQAEDLTDDLRDWFGSDTGIQHVASLLQLNSKLEGGLIVPPTVAIVDIMLALSPVGEEIPPGFDHLGTKRGIAAMAAIRSRSEYASLPMIAFSILGWKDIPSLSAIPGPSVQRIHKSLEDDELRRALNRINESSETRH